MSSPSTSLDDSGPRFALSEFEFVAMMASIQALQAVAIDIMLPALGVIGQDLHLADPNQRQLIVGVFLICAGLGSLFPGSLSDRFGRRKVVLIAISGYLLLSFLCAISGSFMLLLVARAVMGLFSAAMMVMPMTILRDRFEGDRMARTQSMIAMTFMVVPMIAPLLGQTVLLVAGWRWIFGIMGIAAVIVFVWAFLRLPETLNPRHRQRINPRAIATNMGLALRERAAIGYILGAAFVQAAIFGYLNSAQQLVAEHFGAGHFFPLVFGGMALVMASTNFVNSRIVVKFGARRVSHMALLMYLLLGSLHLGLVFMGEGLATFIVVMTMTMCMMSFIGANFQAIALQPFGRTAGAAASVMAFVRMLLGSALGSLIGQAYDGTPRPIIGAMAVCGLISLVLVLYSERGRLFRRLHPPAFYKGEGKIPPQGIE